MKIITITFVLFFLWPGLTKELSDLEKQLVERSESLVPESLSLLEKIVNINSGTQNPEGVKKVGFILKEELDRLGMKTWWLNGPQTDRGGHLFAETKGSLGPNILIISHIDTVFDKDSPFQKFTKKGNKAFGPGVIDAKGGIVIILSALKALKMVGVLDHIKIRLALMGDEEMPATDSKGPIRSHLIDLAKKSDIALGFEYAVETINKATIARRSYLSWTIEVSGKGGHSSKIFSSDKGYGTNFSAFQILNNIRKKFHKHRYLTINPGLIIGGTNVELPQHGVKGQGSGKNNVIAKKTVITGDLRTISLKQLNFAKRELRKLTSKPLNQTKATITFNERDNYPPMSPNSSNKKLLEVISQASQDLGYGKVTALDPGLRGTADIVFAAPHVKALVDGLGALGEGAHSEKESIDLDLVPKLIKRTSLLLYRLKDSNMKQFKN